MAVGFGYDEVYLGALARLRVCLLPTAAYFPLQLSASSEGSRPISLLGTKDLSASDSMVRWKLLSAPRAAGHALL